MDASLITMCAKAQVSFCGYVINNIHTVDIFFLILSG